MRKRCKVCKKPRDSGKLSAVYKTAYERDDYCSTACCKADHGVPVSSDVPTTKVAG